MKITFLGIGEAFDHQQPNTSMILETNQTTMLLDVGYSVFSEVWKNNLDPNYIDVIYISHIHGDHIFGISPLIKRMTEENRSKKLTIICPKGDSDLIKKIMDLGYRNSPNKTPYELEFKEVNMGGQITFNDLIMNFADTQHSVKNLAIRIESNNKIFCYSGDGNHTDESIALFKNSDLLVHDGYYFDKKTEGHDNMVEVHQFAQNIGVKKIAFTHIHREERKNISKIKKEINKFDIQSLIPSRGNIIDI